MQNPSASNVRSAFASVTILFFMWSNIFTLSLHSLGRDTGHGSTVIRIYHSQPTL